VKHLYELVPAGLKKRIKEDRRKSWDEQQAACVATAWTDLGNASKAVDSSKTKDAEAKLRLKKMKEEHQTRTELLKDMTAKYEDTGEGPSLQSSCMQRDRFGFLSSLECFSDGQSQQSNTSLAFTSSWTWYYYTLIFGHGTGSFPMQATGLEVAPT